MIFIEKPIKINDFHRKINKKHWFSVIKFSFKIDDLGAPGGQVLVIPISYTFPVIIVYYQNKS